MAVNSRLVHKALASEKQRVKRPERNPGRKFDVAYGRDGHNAAVVGGRL